MLVNNAGIQRRVPPADLAADWDGCRQELAINLEEPLHLSALLVLHLRQQPGVAILNVTLGLAFTPFALMPVYCATKAARHSLTLSLRQQLLPTGVQVIEVIWPAVNTDLGGPGLHTTGVPVETFADAVLARVAAGELAVGYVSSKQRHLASQTGLDAFLSSYTSDIQHLAVPGLLPMRQSSWPGCAARQHDPGKSSRCPLLPPTSPYASFIAASCP